MVLAEVETVGGPIPADQLGFTLAHEHVLYGLLGWTLEQTERPSFETQVEACLEAIRPATEGGVRTIIDLTTAECGRDLGVLAEVARRGEVRIVCATGLYARRPAPYFARRSVAELEAFFLHEATEGIAGTRIKAGAIKCAVDGPELNDHEAAALTAGVRVALRARLPLMVHVEPGGAPAVLDLAAGLSLRGPQLVIAHGETADLDGLLQIVDEHDAYVGFDRFGFELTLTDEQRITRIVQLCRRGFAHRILLSHDTIGLFLGRDQGWASGRPGLANWHFGHLTSTILPRLEREGIGEEAIRLMTVANPARVLAARPLDPGAPGA